MPDYTSSFPWDIIWSRPYSNYEKHHGVFWNAIRHMAKGAIVDLACGSSSCWKGFDGNLTGVDFSSEAIRESKINCPKGKFYCRDIRQTPLLSHIYDTVVLCGVVNYYQDLSELMAESMRLVSNTGSIIITINVIDDFPDRHWDEERIEKEFGQYGTVIPKFYDKVGWLLVILTS